MRAHFILSFCAIFIASFLDLSLIQSSSLFFLIAFLIILSAAKKSVPLPIGIVVLAYVVGYPLAAMLPDLYPALWSTASYHAIEYGWLWSLRGFAAFAIGCELILLFTSPTRRSEGPTTSPQSTDRLRFFTAWIGSLAIAGLCLSVFLFGWVPTFVETTAVEGSGTLSQILTLLASLRYPFLVGLVLLRTKVRIGTPLTVLGLVALVISILEIVAIGSKGAVIKLAVVAFLSVAAMQVRLSLRLVTVSLASLASIYASFVVVSEYRAILRSDLAAGVEVFSFGSQAGAFGEAIDRSMPFSESASRRLTEVSGSDIVSRFGAGSFGFVNLLEKTAGQPPREHAVHSLLVPIYSVLPRALVPEKPEFFHSGRNAREYFGWSYGGVSVTLLGSFYFAWGYGGLILGMAVVGASVGIAVRRGFGSPLSSPGWMILAVVLIIGLLDLGVTFQSQVTNIVRVGIILFVLAHIHDRRVAGQPAAALKERG